MAWSSQGRHHSLRGGEEPPGLSGPVEGQGKREQAGEAVRAACLGHKGTWQGQKQTQDSHSDKASCGATCLRAPERWRGATSAGRQSQVAIWPAGTKENTPHGTGLGVGSRDTSLTHSTGQGSGTLWHTTCTGTGRPQQHTCQDVVCVCIGGTL